MVETLHGFLTLWGLEKKLPPLPYTCFQYKHSCRSRFQHCSHRTVTASCSIRQVSLAFTITLAHIVTDPPNPHSTLHANTLHTLHPCMHAMHACARLHIVHAHLATTRVAQRLHFHSHTPCSPHCTSKALPAILNPQAQSSRLPWPHHLSPSHRPAQHSPAQPAPRPKNTCN